MHARGMAGLRAYRSMWLLKGERFSYRRGRTLGMHTIYKPTTDKFFRHGRTNHTTPFTRRKQLIPLTCYIATPDLNGLHLHHEQYSTARQPIIKIQKRMKTTCSSPRARSLSSCRLTSAIWFSRSRTLRSPASLVLSSYKWVEIN